VQVLKRHGAELDAAAVDMWHHETLLHWAAIFDLNGAAKTARTKHRSPIIPPA
jgi:hypothetical protein